MRYEWLQLKVVNATIEDTGNFVLRNAANKVVWQSFDTPTDTLLPNQVFDTGKLLFAWEGDGDWSAGNYSLAWFNPAASSYTLSANWQNPYPWDPAYAYSSYGYWTQLGFTKAFLTSDGDFRGFVSPSVGSSSIGAAPVLAVANRLLRLTLDRDGNLRMYSWSAGNTNWTVEWKALLADCDVPGRCGPYAICNTGSCGPYSTCNGGPCTCPLGFQFIDAKDTRRGCRRVDPAGYCARDAKDSFTPSMLADWRFNDLAHLRNVTISSCKSQCLASCDCEAVISVPPDASGLASDCWHKRFALLNGAPTTTRQTFFRVASNSLLYSPSPSPLPLPQTPGIPYPAAVATNDTTSKLKTILPATIAGVVLFLALLAVSCLAIRKIGQKLDQKRLQAKWLSAKGSLVRFTYNEILLVTRKFDMRIGEGGFGTVFKGQVAGSAKSGVTVAVKRLNKELSSHVEKEFTNEVEILGVIHHVHLVSLLGYCSEGDHRLLVYEYLENGSLDRILFREKKLGFPVLEWKPRFAIALATARGLAYLHDDCKQRIIHCDVKPENILLDTMLCAKVADFGLSRMKNRDQTTQMRSKTSHIRGTLGYLAPEYWRPEGVNITNKVDVFSFGMVLLEIVSGRRNLRPSLSGLLQAPESLYFPSWAFPKMETGAFMELVDPALAGVVDPDEVKRALRVAFWCINDKPQARPPMSEVVQMLQGQVPVPLPVVKPLFFDSVELRLNEEREQQSTSASQDYSRMLSTTSSSA